MKGSTTSYPFPLFRRFRGALLLALVALSGSVGAQSLEQWIGWGDASMTRGEYYGASRFYAGALALDGGRMSLQWKQAEALRLSNQYDKAVELYERVHRKDAGRTYPEALRWLGEMQLCDGAYDQAEVTWKRVLQKEKDKNSVTAQRARNAILGCAVAREAMAAPREMDLEHLPGPVNTYDSEFGARIGPESTLYFSSLRGELNKDGEVLDTAAYRMVLLRSVRNAATWGEPVVLPTTINDVGDNGNASWSADGKRLYFTRCEKGRPCRIFTTTADGASEALPLSGLGEELLSTQPMIAELQGRETLFFVSDRPGGQGGMDIWFARLEKGAAVELSPLGSAVNTPGNERSPWFDAVSSTLWFSSDFHPGMGGYDIFTNAWVDGTYQTPVHAGVPLNSPANDLYPAYYPDRNEGWITSNRVGSFAAKGETCCNDLYRFSLPEELVDRVPARSDSSTAKLSMQDAMARIGQLQEHLPLRLYFHNDDPEPRSWSTTTEQDYGTAYRRYRALIPEYEREGDASALRPFFRDEVDRGYLELAELLVALREALDAGVTVTLDVRGHASPLAANDYNTNLSLRRIESLRNHLHLASGGALRPYLENRAENGATLSIKVLPFGEEQAPAGISDQLQDLKRSVYAVDAARERRIEVVALRVQAATSKGSVETHLQQLGLLKQEEEREFVFMIHNSGTRELRLLESKAECGCAVAELPVDGIAPGESRPVVVRFNGRAPLGPLDRTVQIRTNGVPERIELSIEGEVVP